MHPATPPGPIPRRGSRLRAALVGLAVSAAGCGGSASLTHVGPADLLARAEQHIDRGDELRAIEELTQITTDHPGVAFIDRVVFQLGRAYLEAEDYPQAEAQFRRLARDYPFSDYADDAAYLTGESPFRQMRPPWGDATKAEEAEEGFRAFLREYPDSPLAGDARAKIQEIREWMAEKKYLNAKQYWQLKRYGATIIYCQSLLDEYPEAEVTPEGVLLLARAKAKRGDVAGACETVPRLFELPAAEGRDDLLDRALEALRAWRCTIDGGVLSEKLAR